MRFRIVLISLMILSCGKSNPYNPTPMSTPTPTPIPIVKAIPIFTGNGFSPNLVGAVPCCDDPNTSVDEGIRDGWSYATPALLSYIASYGINATHFRTGPFKDGSNSVSELRDLVMFANSQGLLVEVDLIDNWALANNETPWGDKCEVTQHAPKQRHRDHVANVVNAVKDLRVIFNLGNEGFRCNPSEAWEQGLFDEAKNNGANTVGSNSFGNVGDYHTIHGFQVPSAGEILTESDNKPHTPEEWMQLYRDIKAAGAYVMFWRGPMSDADWDRLLTLYKVEPK